MPTPRSLNDDASDARLWDRRYFFRYPEGCPHLMPLNMRVWRLLVYVVLFYYAHTQQPER